MRDVPGAGQVNERELQQMQEFLDGIGEVGSPSEAVSLLCVLSSLVAHSGVTEFPSTPADCFCSPREDLFGRDGIYWRNSGDELRFIVNAVLRALREEAKP